MACLSCIKAKKACVYHQESLSCERCIRLDKTCIPKPPKKTKRTNTPKSNKVISSKLGLHKNDRTKSDPSGTTYQVDGHVTGICHRSVRHIVTNPTYESFNHLFPATTIPPNTSLPSVGHHINTLGNRWIPPIHADSWIETDNCVEPQTLVPYTWLYYMGRAIPCPVELR